MKKLNKAIRLISVFVMLFAAMPDLRTAFADDPAVVTEVRDQLAQFMGVAAGIGDLEELGQALPLSNLSPSADEALGIVNLFANPDTSVDSIRKRIQQASGTEFSQLEAALNALNGQVINGVTLAVSGADINPNASPIEISLPLQASRQISIPFEFAQGPLSLDGGGIDATISLSATFNFRFDTAQIAAPDLAFSLAGEPAIAVSVNATAGAIGGFDSLLGFAAVDVGGNAELHMVVNAAFDDPDNNNSITADELITTAPNDLFNVGFGNGPGNDVNVALSLSAPGLNISGSEAFVPATITVSDDDLSNGANLTPSVQFGSLGDFANITADQALEGLVQFASGLISAQGIGDIKLPFTNTRLGDAFSLANKLTGLVKQQGDALVFCGTSGGNTDLPKGSVRNLDPGQTIYCRAVTLQNPTSASWSIKNQADVNGTVGNNGNNTNAIGTSPLQNVTLTMPQAPAAGGTPKVSVTFTDPDGAQHTSTLRMLAFQDLARLLGQALGITVMVPAGPGKARVPKTVPTTITPNYNTDNKTVSLSISLSENPNPYTLGRLDFGSQLSSTTSLIALQDVNPAMTPSLILTPSFTLSLTFGLILVQNVADITPGDDATYPASHVDRFFVQVDTGANSHEFTADAGITANVNLAGKLAFVGITAKGDASAQGTAFSINRADAAKPMLRLDIVPPAGGIPILNRQPVPNAIRIREMAASLANSIQARCNAKMEGGLLVEAFLGSSSDPNAAPVATGTIGIDWPEAFTRVQGGGLGDGNCLSPNFSDLDVTPDVDFNDNLLPFDIDSLNPQALLNLILDNLEAIADGLGNVLSAGPTAPVKAGQPASLSSVFDRELPIVGTKLSDLVTQGKALKKKIETLRTGGHGPGIIVCHAVDDDNLFANENAPDDVANVAPGTVVYCRGRLPDPTPPNPNPTTQSVVWNINGGEPCEAPACAGGSNRTNVATVGLTPTDSAAFKVTDSSGTFKMTLDYIVNNGSGNETQNAEYPAASVPASIQELEKSIEKLLGLPADAFEFKLQNVDGDASKELVIRLGYGVCTPGFTGLPNSACQRSFTLPFDLNQSLNFDLPQIGSLPGDYSLVGLSTSGALTADFGAFAQFDIGFQLDSNGPPIGTPFVLDSSRLDLAATMEAPNVSINANLGPLKFGVAGEAKLGANFSLSDNTAVPNNPQIAQFGDFDDVVFAGNQVECTSGASTFTGQGGCLAATMTLNNTQLQGPLGIEIDLNPPDVDVTFPTDLEQQLLNAFLNYDMLFEGLNYLLDLLKEALDAETYGSKVPLVGDNLDTGASNNASASPNVSDGASIIQSFQDNVLEPIQDIVSKTQSLANAEAVETCLHDMLWDALGPDSVGVAACAGAVGGTDLDGLDILRDIDGSNTAGDTGDVIVRSFCGGTTECTNANLPTEMTDVKIVVSLGKEYTANTPFDLGLPGFRFRSVADPNNPNPNNGQIGGSMEWQLDLRFGVSRDQGFYIDPTPDCTSGPTCSGGRDETAKVSVAGGLTLPSNMEAELAFLVAEIRNNHTGNPPPADVELNFSLPFGSQVISMSTLSTGLDPSDFAPTLTASTDIDLHIRTKLRGDEAAGFPSVETDFVLEWEYDILGGAAPGTKLDALKRRVSGSQLVGLRPKASGTQSAKISCNGKLETCDFAVTSIPEPTVIGFEDVNINVGTFVAQFLAPIVEEVQKITKPVQPVVDVVQAPIPGISDLSEAAGGDPITMLDLLKIGCAGSCEGKVDFIERVIGLIDFINGINVSALGPNAGNDCGSGGLCIPLGDFTLKSDEVMRPAPTPDQADRLIDDANTNPNFQSSLANSLGGNRPGGGAVLNGRHGSDLSSEQSEKGTGLTFPFIKEPSQAFGLLMGKDIDLIKYDTGFMDLTGGFSFTFPPIPIGPVPLSIGIFGNITLRARVALGYDTSGLRAVLTGASAEHLFDGIFIDDLYEGQDILEVALIGEIGASASVSILIFSAGIEGGIRLTVGLNVKDPNADGKLKIAEIIELGALSNPLCLFDFEGKLEFFLRAFVKVDLFFWSQTWKFPIIDITLVDWSIDLCSPPSPEPATVTTIAGIGKVLRVNIGPDKAARNVLPDETEETVTVRQIERSIFINGAQVVKLGFNVNVLGSVKDYIDGVDGVDLSGLVAVYANANNPGGDDKDTLSFEAGTSANLSDTLAFTTPVIAFGGADNDKISGGNGPDKLNGGDGSDKIDGLAGNDFIGIVDGLAGAETENGDDILSGGLGVDTIKGGADADTVNGDEDNDLLYGDKPGDNTVTGNDNMDGGPGTDYMEGGPGQDGMSGGEGVDTMNGDEQINSCTADGSNTGAGDLLQGGAGNDIMNGGFGDDTMVGANGDDTMCGNAGNDIMDGDDGEDATAIGDDTMNGGSGNDEMHGRANTPVDENSSGGIDWLYGNSGHDKMFGEEGPDVLIGGIGRDRIDGGTGTTKDILLGDNGTVAAHSGFEQENNSVAQILGLVTVVTTANSGTVNCADLGTGGETTDTADCMSGNSGNDYLFGEGGADQMFGDNGDDYMQGNNGADIMRGGQQVDTMFGNDGNDEMYGDSGNDKMYGNNDADTMRGGIGDDYMEGNNGIDTMNGDANQDDMIGGTSTPGLADDGDFMYGDGNHDVMVGDNGQITRPGGPPNTFDGSEVRVVTLYDVAVSGSCGSAATASGNDSMRGNDGNDVMYGQGDSDAMHGGNGDDFMYGNADVDTMYGDDGQDDLVGGTGRRISNDPASAVDGRCDDLDNIHGGDGPTQFTSDYDVISGDNAVISRPLDPNGQWIVNTFNAAITRNIRFFDVAIVGVLSGVGTSGGDNLFGENRDDLMYGQGGNDTMQGGNGDDYMEGNDGQDTMYGNAGNDDMAGGTGRINDDPATGTNGRLDDGENDMFGGTGFDFMAGDNAIIRRTLDEDGAWIPNTFNGGIQHEIIILLDIDSSDTAVVSGNDTMHGDEQDDVMYGQGGNDAMHGGADQDYMEGNAGGDSMRGDAGQDDMAGGTGRVNNDPPTGTNGRLDGDDFMYGESDTTEGTDGGSGADFMTGDNAIITRPLDQNGQWLVNSFNGSYTRNYILLDVENSGAPAVSPNVHGDDMMWGNSNDDIMYGQGGLDTMHGNAGQDYMEGNHDTDYMWGDGNQDDMLGGSAIVNRLDKTDYMFGDTNISGLTLPSDSHDVMLGDNGTIVRPLDQDGQWIPIAYHFGASSRITRDVTMLDTAPGDMNGSDVMRGNGADDDMYGQFDDSGVTPLTANVTTCAEAGGGTPIVPGQGDLMCGDAGEDAMLGDQGVVVNRAEDGSRTRTISVPAPFLQEVIFPEGQLSRLTTLNQIATGGHDVMQGGTEGDWMHGGAGSDLMNGNSGDDVAFGDNGNDAIWGGTNNDHGYGSQNDDFLDIVPRPAAPGRPADPPAWFEVAPVVDSLQGFDIHYGGFDRDALQADVGGPGPQPGDRLLDWVGNYNIYFTCPGAYGEGVITRFFQPDMQAYMVDQATGDGATDVGIPGTSGFNELRFVYTADITQNNGKPYPGSPGHFVCPPTP